VRPQENGNRCDVRWMTLGDGAGAGLKIEGSSEKPLSVSAWPYSREDLAAAEHDSELPKRDFVSVQIDHVQMGVGGENSWWRPVLEEDRVKADGKYEWSFVMGVVGE
jgi:beta-galactosidase